MSGDGATRSRRENQSGGQLHEPYHMDLPFPESPDSMAVANRAETALEMLIGPLSGARMDFKNMPR
jgi:hypothetical protein